MTAAGDSDTSAAFYCETSVITCDSSFNFSYALT